MKLNSNQIARIVFFILLATLIFKGIFIPGGLILPGFFLFGIVICIVLLGGLLIGGIVKLIYCKAPFWKVFYIGTSVLFLFLHYKSYSPTLEIKVPIDYTGEINLIKSNLDDNILTVDSNGIGYLNEYTFGKVYSPPIVVDQNGKDLTKQCVGFNSSTFFSLTTSGNIKALSFQIVPIDKIGEKQHYHKSLSEVIDHSKVK